MVSASPSEAYHILFTGTGYGPDGCDLTRCDAGRGRVRIEDAMAAPESPLPARPPALPPERWHWGDLGAPSGPACRHDPAPGDPGSAAADGDAGGASEPPSTTGWSRAVRQPTVVIDEGALPGGQGLASAAEVSACGTRPRPLTIDQ